MKVVVVESPAKAKTINKYLGDGYRVLASFGHIRDLPPKDGSVRPDDDFAMDWQVDDKAKARLAEIAKEARRADAVYLATDPDREGEAISWHLHEVLRERDALKRGTTVARVTFNEITRNAVLEAFRNARTINQELVDAYLARRALDYLVGFTLSPVLWRKLPGSRSAGRVQSVALRLVCEREAEIEAFRSEEYWSVAASLQTRAGEGFEARLVSLDGRKLEKLSLKTKDAAAAAVAAIEASTLSVAEVDRRSLKRHPQPPFTTSTLQQEASRKLGFGATRTMQIAQRLYEGIDLGGETVGLITYMRTDGVQLSGEAVTGARALIAQDHGPKYVPPQPRVYKSKAKNAQEAHEAIRPTDFQRRPGQLAGRLEPEQLKLYELIWKRAVASQMESAVLDQVTADIAGERVGLRAVGTTILFDGFLTLYQEGRDDSDEDEGGRLPKLMPGDPLKRLGVTPAQHFTQPPPRYSEASLVKKLEELGIGRPSTYASILQVLQDRNYVRLEQKRFIPEDRGRIVTAFLSAYFQRYVEYDFTADLENQLDDISGGRIDWREVLRRFWVPFQAAIAGTKDLKISDVIEHLDQTLGAHFFPDDGSGKAPRGCPSCHKGTLGLRLGKTGGFIGCSNYPECRYTRPLGIDGEGEGGDGDLSQPRLLGQSPDGQPVTLRKGPYGIYVQLGDGEKPKRASTPKGEDLAAMTLDRALALLALPRLVGIHPESREEVTAGIGRFGPYLKHGGTYKSLGRDDDVLTIGLNRAVVLLAEAKSRGPKAIRVLGPHPADGKDVGLFEGRYGPYVQHGALNATLPRGVEVEALTLEQAILLLHAKAEKTGTGPAKRGASRAKAKAAPAEDGAASSGAAKRATKSTTAGKTGAKTAAGKTGAKTAATAAASGSDPKPTRAKASSKAPAKRASQKGTEQS
ncbi:MAG: type I DNA topoisomerase [Alphaproteobacteria bacterium]|nr:type I DNA topoisomerase [Alphaproteobacteria bacterium]